MNEHLNDPEIQQLVEASLNDSPAFPKNLMSHVISCAVCRAEYDNYKLIFELLGNPSTLPVPDFFADQVVRIIEVKQERKYLLKKQLIYLCAAGVGVWLSGLVLDSYIPSSSSSAFVSTASFQMIATFGFLCFIFILLAGDGKMIRKENLLGELTL